MGNKKDKKEEKEKFKIIYKDCGTGRSKVSIVKRKSDGELLIWKRARHYSPRHVESYRKEIKKSKYWRKFGLSEVKIHWHPDKVSILKTYIKGKTLKQVLENDHHFFSEADSKQAKALIKFIDLLVDSGYYIHDMKGSNIVFNGKKWNIIDGGILDKESRSSVRKDYRKYLFEKWSRDLDSKKEINALELFLKKYV